MPGLPELPDKAYHLCRMKNDGYLVIHTRKYPTESTPKLNFYELKILPKGVKVLGRDYSSTPPECALQLGTFGTIEEAWAAILLHNSTRTL